MSSRAHIEAGRDAVYAGKQMQLHVESEYRDSLEEILTTLTPDGYGFGYVMPLLGEGEGAKPALLAEAGARIGLRVESSREGIRSAYEYLHGLVSIDELIPIVEIRGGFYTFFQCVVVETDRASGQPLEVEGAVIFPTSGVRGVPGITGEVRWAHFKPGRAKETEAPGGWGCPGLTDGLIMPPPGGDLVGSAVRIRWV